MSTQSPPHSHPLTWYHRTMSSRSPSASGTSPPRSKNWQTSSRIPPNDVKSTACSHCFVKHRTAQRGAGYHSQCIAGSRGVVLHSRASRDMYYSQWKHVQSLVLQHRSLCGFAGAGQAHFLPLNTNSLLAFSGDNILSPNPKARRRVAKAPRTANLQSPPFRVPNLINIPAWAPAQESSRPRTNTPIPSNQPPRSRAPKTPKIARLKEGKSRHTNQDSFTRIPLRRRTPYRSSPTPLGGRKFTSQH